MADVRIRARDLVKLYQRGTQVIRAVDGVDLDVRRGELVALVGTSGSGKSTILNLLAGLDTPTSGAIEVDGDDLRSLGRRGLAAYRARRVGMVFQAFHLIPHRTALQNVELALYFDGTPRSDRERLAREALEIFGLGDRLDHLPADLSGGEAQRVALARAVVKRPEFLFADEPTGNLDRENAEQIAAMLGDLAGRGLSVVLVTHDLVLAESRAHRILRLEYGRIPSDTGEKA